MNGFEGRRAVCAAAQAICEGPALSVATPGKRRAEHRFAKPPQDALEH